jgi:hypothetical protein
MTSMGYPQPYPMGQAPGYNQITRRMLTDAERDFPIGVYRGAQKTARGVGIACLVLFILNTFVLSAVVTDQITLDTLTIMMSVFMGVFGLVGIGMAVNTLIVRKKVSDAMMNGTAVEVVGPAYRTNAGGKVQTWTVGPVSMMATREVLGLLREGAPTSILCVPSLKAAIAINYVGLKNGAKVMLPPNLESMAVPMGQAAMPMGGQVPVMPYAAYGPPVAQPQPSQTTPGEDYLPPPPD